MATAQALADGACLKGEDNSNYIVGYAAGIVSHWADTQAAVKPRYMSYLQAALAGSSMFQQ